MIKWAKNRIEKSPALQHFIVLAKKFTLPGFDKVPVFDVVRFLFEEIKKDLIPTRARSIAYSFFIAFFPGIIFLFTLLPYIPLDGFEEAIFALISDVIPDQVYRNFIEFTVSDLLNKPREGLLSIGALLTLYFSTQGVVSMMSSFNKTYSIYTRRNFFQIRWMAIKLTIVLFFLFLISIGLIITGELLINWCVEWLNIKSGLTVFLLHALRYSIIILLFFLSVSFIYYYGPSTKKKFRFISPGSTLTTVGSIAASIGFSYYVGSIDKFDNIYGFFGSIIIFLGWMYINAFVLLVGFELNASIYYNKNLQQMSDQ